MNRDEASEVLELSSHASPAERSAQYDTLRRQLEDKLAKAPTPGLREKYRHNLRQLEEAFALLSQTDDGSALPVLQKQGAGNKEQGAPANSPVGSPLAATSATRSAQAPTLHSKSTSGGKEFAVVAVIAVLLLGAGGWYVIKARAENEEKARIAAETKAEADRVAAAAKAESERREEEKRVAAENRRQAEEADKARVAGAAKAEQDRLEKLTAQVRVGFSEANLQWEQAERAENAAERDLSELKSNARAARDLSAGERRELELRIAAQGDYHRWLADQLITHPARRARVRTEEMLNSRQPESATEALAQYQQALSALLAEITRRKPSEDDLFGSLAISSEPAGITWDLTDAFGRKFTGKTPATVPRAGIGPATVTWRRPDWNDESATVVVSARNEAHAEFTYQPARLDITSRPAGATVLLGGVQVGRTPLSLADQPATERNVELRLDGHKSRIEKINLRAGATAKMDVELAQFTDHEIITDFSNRWNGVWGGYASGVGFQCRFTAGSTNYSEWNTTGRFAGNAPVTVGLEVISRQPLSLNRVWLLNGQKISFGYFTEENGQLVYVAVKGSRSVRAPMSRVSN